MPTKLSRKLLIASVGALLSTGLFVTQASAQMDMHNSRNNARINASAPAQAGDRANVRGDINARAQSDTPNSNFNARAQANPRNENFSARPQADVRDRNMNARTSDRIRVSNRTNIRTREARQDNIRVDNRTRIRSDVYADRRSDRFHDRRFYARDRGPSFSFSFGPDYDAYAYDTYAYQPYASDSYYTYAAESPACTCRNNWEHRRW